MKIQLALAYLAIFPAGVSSIPAAEEAAPQFPAEATVTADYVHVRGRPSIYSEVLGQVNTGDTVVVLQQITRENPIKDEPVHWSRIRMPVETPVWVSGRYVDEETNTVLPEALNMRAGPSQNFGIVGQLKQGAILNVLSKTNDWLEIKAPEHAYAYMASKFLRLKGSAAPGTLDQETPSLETPVIPLESEATPEKTTESAATEEESMETEEQSEEAQPEPEESSELVINDLEEEPVAEPPPVIPLEPGEMETADSEEMLPEVALPVAEQPEEEPNPREVIREGVVGSFVSITAPTYFKLVNVHNKGTMNYIYTENPKINLKDLKGRRLVVKGEEFMHPRWPRTPVLKISEILELK